MALAWLLSAWQIPIPRPTSKVLGLSLAWPGFGSGHGLEDKIFSKYKIIYKYW